MNIAVYKSRMFQFYLVAFRVSHRVLYVVVKVVEKISAFGWRIDVRTAAR
jgi:hypothetical protein